MRSLIFDIETNGLLDELTKVHCLCIRDAETGELVVSAAQLDPTHPKPLAVVMLEEADLLIGHNIIAFDIPALQKVYPDFKPKAVLRDTLLLSRMFWPEIRMRDAAAKKRNAVPKNLWGRYSLEAWGYRLGDYKGDYKGGWDQWSQEMQDYCEQDTQVTFKLWRKIQTKKWTYLDKNKKTRADRYSEQAIDLEHKFAQLMFLQERHGFKFDKTKAADLMAVLGQRRQELKEQCDSLFPPKVVKMKSQWWETPDGTEWGTKKEAVASGWKAKDVTKGRYKTKEIPFNPGSRDHIAQRFKEKYDWQPKEYTPDGKPKVDETILKALPYPEAQLLAELFLIQKRIAMLAEGKAAWLKLEQDGWIHGRVTTVGAVTRRCTHQSPNVAQVPGVSKPYGRECRDLFTVPDGYVLMGCDASGLELRCLAHYMARWDGGAYARELLEGDIHTANQKAAGLPTRDNAKTFIYGFLYGAGDAKIGEIVGKGPKVGKALKARFLKQTPALKKLKEAIDTQVDTRGYLRSIDGGILTVRHKHAALNTLLQSCGSIAVKLFTVLLWEDLTERGWVFGREYANVAHVHDEVQIQVKEELADELGEAAVAAIRKAGEMLDFRCHLDGEYKIGRSWAETH